MSWTMVVNIISNEHFHRAILIGSIVGWNVWKFCIATNNLSAALHNQMELLDPFTNAAILESTDIAIRSGADAVLKVAKLALDFHPFVWDLTGQIGLQQLTSRALCYMLIVNIVQQVEEGVTLLMLTQVSPLAEPLKRAATIQALLVLANRSAFSFLDVMTYSVFSRETAWALNLALKLFNLFCIQPWMLLRYQLPDVEIPGTLKTKADSLRFPVDCIRIGGGQEPRAKHVKALFFDYIIVNKSLLSTLDDDQALAIFCRELGHWDLGHSYISNSFALLEIVLGDLLLLLGCVNDKASSFFHVDPSAHVVVQVSLMKYFVQSMLCGIVRGIGSIVNARLEIKADEYAGQVFRANQSGSILAQGPRGGSLVDAWKKLAPADPENFQFFDEFFAEFFHGQPTLPHRLSKMDRRLRFSPDVAVRDLTPV